MAYVAPTNLKKNSLGTTTTGDITSDATTIPIADCSVAYDVNGVLITKGWVLGYNQTTIPPEEITVSACSVAYGTGGAGNLTVVRAINYDVNTGGTAQGAAYAWPSNTKIAVVVSIGIYNSLVAALNWLNGAAPNAHAASHLPSGTDPLSLYPITTTIYIDGNRTANYTADGSISKPFLTISAAVAAMTGSVAYVVYIAPGTYTESGDLTLPNVPITVYGNNATLVNTGHTITIPNPYFIRYNLFTTANIVYNNFTTGARCLVMGGGITGNITVNSYVEFTQCQLNGGVVTVGATGQCVVSLFSPTSKFTSAGVLTMDKINLNTSYAGYLVTSTGGQLTVSNCIFYNSSSNAAAGCITCDNGAIVTAPNIITNTDMYSAGSGYSLYAGTAYTIVSKLYPASTNTVLGTHLVPVAFDMLGAGTVMGLGSDATGDMYYRNALGILTRLGIGGANTVPHGGTVPAYSAVVEADITLADNTTNDATTTKHGFLQKVVAGASSGIMNFLGCKYGETVSAWKALFDATNPAMNGTASPGTADTAARRDHVHASDTSRAPTASPTFTGTVTIPSANDSLVLSGTPPPNGSLLIGDGTGFRNAVLTAGSNVTITNAAGEITIAAAPGGVTFSGVSGTTQQAAVNNGYIPLNASLTTITLPATAAVGDVVAITGYGSGLWKLAQNASQLIHFNSLVTTTGTGGSIAATHQFDTVVVRCVVANTTWVVENAVGNLDVI